MVIKNIIMCWNLKIGNPVKIVGLSHSLHDDIATAIHFSVFHIKKICYRNWPDFPCFSRTLGREIMINEMPRYHHDKIKMKKKGKENNKNN